MCYRHASSLFCPYAQLVVRASRLSFPCSSGCSRQSGVCKIHVICLGLLSVLQVPGKAPTARGGSCLRLERLNFFCFYQTLSDIIIITCLRGASQPPSCGAWSESPLPDISNLFSPSLLPCTYECDTLQRSISQSLEDALPNVLRVANFRSSNTTDMNFLPLLDRFVSIVLRS